MQIFSVAASRRPTVFDVICNPCEAPTFADFAQPHFSLPCVKGGGLP